MAAYTTAVVQRRTERLSSDIQLTSVLRYPPRNLANFALDRVQCLYLCSYSASLQVF